MYIINKFDHFFKVETNTLDATKLKDCRYYTTAKKVCVALSNSYEYEIADIDAYAMYVTDDTISDGHNSLVSNITANNREEFINTFEM